MPEGSFPGLGGIGVLSPVSVAEFLLHARIDTDADDALIAGYLEAATRWAQDYNGRKFLTQTCVESFDAFPAVFRPAGCPLAAVTSIVYTDMDGSEQTLDPAAYDVDIYTEPGRVAPAYNESWPDTRDLMNAVTVTYTAGYGAAADVPETKRIAIMMIAAALYENREETSPLQVHQVPFGARALLSMDRRVNV